MDLQVCWSNTAKDILERIYKCVNDPLDLLFCLGVCTSWHLVGSEFIRQRLPNLPPLIFSVSESRKDSNDIDKRMVFYNNQSLRKREFSLPAQFHNSCLSGGSHGWLIAVQREAPREIYLIHALSHAQVRLPSASKIRFSYRLKIIISANPLSNPNCPVLAIDPDKQHIAFCRLGDTSWTKLETFHVKEHSAATFYKGRFYIYTRKEEMLQIGVMSSGIPKIETVQMQGLSSEIREMNWTRDNYLLESGEDMLLVTKFKTETEAVRFVVYKLDNERNLWIEVPDLGNKAIFLGYNNSVSAVVSSCGGSRAFRANCIYSIDDTVLTRITTYHARRGVYDMKTQDFKGWIPGCTPIWSNSPLSWVTPQV